MIFYFDGSGNSIATITERLYKGSNKANIIYMFCPLDSTCEVDVAFTLPNGETSQRHPMELITETDGIDVFDESDNKFNCWKISLPTYVTQYSGDLSVQFYVTCSAGEVIATAVQMVNVEAGLPVLNVTDTDAYSELRTEQTRINSQVSAAVQAVSSKVSSAVGEDEKTYIYGYKGSGDVHLSVADDVPLGGQLPAYDFNGNLRTGEPVNSYDAVSKGYASTNYASGMEWTINPATFVMTLKLKNQYGQAIATQTIDLPMETLVHFAYYKDDTKELIMQLLNGQSLSVPVRELVNGLLNKETNDGTATEAYVFKGSAQSSIEVSKTAVADTIAEYGTNGVLKVGTPVSNGDAVNKEYADSTFGVQTVKDSLSATINITVNSNTEYFYGTLTSLSLTFGSGSVGDSAYITFSSGETPTLVTLNTQNVNINGPIECSSNVVVEISAIYDGSKWNACWREI